MLFSTPQRAALISVASNTLLVAGKAVVAILSGSAALLSEALHSGLDLLAAFLSWISLKFSANPPDWEHPFGHGKLENVSAFLEGLLILAVALGVFYQAGRRLFEPVAITLAPLGLAVLAVSALVNLGVSWALKNAARRFDSVALDADAAHLATDVYTSLGAMIGLLGYQLTGHHLFDTVAALGVGLIILWIGLKVTHQGIHGLLDTRLPQHEEVLVRELVAATSPVLELKELKSRKAGPVRYLNLTLVVCRWDNLEEIHALCDKLEAQIQSRFPGALVFIHPEPCPIKPPPGQDAEECACPLKLNISYPLKK
ncbi:MAG: cation diffusion facilitator family transporter [Thermodesulfobacteriota bacterium]